VMIAGLIAAALGLVLIAVGIGAMVIGRNPSATDAAPAALATPAGNASSSASTVASASQPATASGSAVGSATVSSTVTSSGASIEAYRGLGSWIDIYDDTAWKYPEAAIDDMASHGVKTLYIETANYNSPVPIRNPAAISRFITAAHAHNMFIVAWYLPNMKAKSVDYERVKRAIEFTTPDGQKFDSFALDIEATAVKSDTARNRGLKTLSERIRALVGPTYPLGGIIPSPVGLAKSKGYWNNFPYQSVATYYDVMMPMSYYTYHGKSAGAAYADTMGNVRIIRAQPGCATIPIHLIGGIAENSSAAQVAAFARAAQETQCFGASLYGWPGTNGAKWRAMAPVKTD
jgi:hypothetical protein